MRAGRDRPLLPASSGAGPPPIPASPRAAMPSIRLWIAVMAVLALAVRPVVRVSGARQGARSRWARPPQAEPNTQP